MENTHFPKEDHGYQESKRQAMYPFMVKHLDLNPDGVLNKETGVFDESKNTIENPATMRSFSTIAEMPKHALKPGALITLR